MLFLCRTYKQAESCRLYNVILMSLAHCACKSHVDGRLFLMWLLEYATSRGDLPLPCLSVATQAVVGSQGLHAAPLSAYASKPPKLCPEILKALRPFLVHATVDFKSLVYMLQSISLSKTEPQKLSGQDGTVDTHQRRRPAALQAL